MNTNFKIFCDDSLNILKTLPSNSIDSLVSDPPAGIGLLNLDWDKDKGGRDEWINWLTQIMRECHRVLKPGAHGFVWAIPRTSHWTALAMENAGFLVKDVVTHVYGCGFPKSQSIEKMIQRSKRIDLSEIHKVGSWIRQRKNEKNLRVKDIDQFIGIKGITAHWIAKPGNEQVQMPSLKRWKQLKELLGEAPKEINQAVFNYHNGQKSPEIEQKLLEASKKWSGWGTALKPASEHWILVQKPLKKRNIAANVIEIGTGALNVDDSRIHSEDLRARKKVANSKTSPFFGNHTSETNKVKEYIPHEGGRFPANFLMTSSKNESCPVELMKTESEKDVSKYFKKFNPDVKKPFHYCPKPTVNEKGAFNSHPTVKPLGLMRYLIKMITPPDGIVLDPFMGSGTTGVATLFEGFYFLGIEKEEKYFQICQRRLCGVQNRSHRNTNPSPSQSTNTGLRKKRKLVCTYDKTKENNRE
ncbi:MAG: site-specific DNA-methyltransferase [Bdellovibrionales bacterium]|nr:site-specific DNA-methyltransferase [Bdellovibrionales bacterium]NQZ18922.1 site-specific DNA-methyltransferase [Bdellovibrionales bacterium]